MTSISALNLESLPSDVGALHEIIRALAQALSESQAQFERLTQQIINLRRAQFGQSSEQLSGQGEIFAQAVSLPVPPAQTQTVTYERARRGRPALSKDLPRVRIDYDLSQDEKAGFGTLERIGEERSETLDYIPAKLQVLEHVRATYAGVRKDDGQSAVVTAPMPPAPLPKSNASPGLLAHVLVSKYADHLPLNRIESIFKRQGAVLPRSTLCDWVLGSTELLGCLYEALKSHVLAAPKLHADDTILPLIEGGRGRTAQARLWAYLGAGARLDAEHRWIEHPAAVFYEFTGDRRGAHVQRMLKDYAGYLQADAYAGFDALFATERIVEVGCWAHARRKFFEIAEASPKGIRTSAAPARTRRLTGSAGSMRSRPRSAKSPRSAKHSFART